MSDRIFTATATALRVRAAPAPDADILGALPRGQLVARLDLVERGDWWRVFADTPASGAYVGYVASAWLAPVPQTPAAQTAGDPAAPEPSSPESTETESNGSESGEPEPAERQPAEPAPSRPLAAPIPPMLQIAGALSVEAFEAQAARLGVGMAEFWAVIEIEARGEGFFVGGDKHRLPQILYERHIFSRETGHRFDGARPDISSRTGYIFETGAPARDRYGPLDDQYPRLVEAAALDREAALKSASWGLGQIMGFNFAPAGYGDVETFVAAMRRSEDLQFEAFTNFLINMELAGKLRARDWAEFARGYNGPTYARFSYDSRLAMRYSQLKTRTPDILLRQAQIYLKFLGRYGGKADGAWGPASRAAVSAYLDSKGERISPDLLEAKPAARFLTALVAEASVDAALEAPRWPLPPPPSTTEPTPPPELPAEAPTEPPPEAPLVA